MPEAANYPRFSQNLHFMAMFSHCRSEDFADADSHFIHRGKPGKLVEVDYSQSDQDAEYDQTDSEQSVENSRAGAA